MRVLPSFGAQKCYDLGDANLGAWSCQRFSNLQLETIARVIAELRAEWQADIDSVVTAAVAKLRGENDLTETVAELRGQVTALMHLLGNNDLTSNGNGKSRSRKAKSVEASEVIRKLTVTNRD
jgi:hypothetical protein